MEQKSAHYNAGTMILSNKKYDSCHLRDVHARTVLIYLFINYLTPFYFIPYPLMEKITNRGIKVAHHGKTNGYFYFTCKKINGSKIEDQNYNPVADRFYNRSAKCFCCLMCAGDKFFNHIL